MTTPGPPPPAAVRLRRLRWWLTGLLVGVNTPALLIFAWLTIRADAAQEREQLDPLSNTVRMTVMTLRRKLGDPPVLETVRGAGYRM